ncbi:MAG: hypothetical protein AB1427_13030 [Thermodesulfobacteriota bacterium]
MYKVPIIISILLIIAAIGTSLYLMLSPNEVLNDNQLVSSLIAVFACLGVLISATFIVYSYIQTNQIFLLGQKPSLLIQVESQHLQPNPQTQSVVPFTIIHYTNTSQNEFTDLTLIVKLRISNRDIDLSDLFKPKMFMASRDQRNKRFETLAFLSKRGVDINNETAYGNQVLLIISYTFTFNKELEERNGPEYKWNGQIQHWELT